MQVPKRSIYGIMIEDGINVGIVGVMSWVLYFNAFILYVNFKSQENSEKIMKIREFSTKMFRIRR